MRTLVLADLHDDFWADKGRDPFRGAEAVLDGVEALVIAGDISNKPKVRWKYAFARLRARFGTIPIHVLPGNHDFYDWRIDDETRLAEIAAAFDVGYAQAKTLRLGNARVICATLWTDLELGGGRAENETRVPAQMNDYRYIRKASGGYRRILPKDILAIHHAHRSFITEALAAPFDGPSIVITHHAPHPSVLGTYAKDLPAAYGSDLSEILESPQAPDLWLFGHAHDAQSMTHGRTELRNVSLGYPMDITDAEIPARLARGLLDL